MKNRLLILLLVCVLPILSFGQSGTFKAGVIGGFNAAQLDGDLLAGYNKFGLHTGLTVGVQISELFRLNMEILYTQKGSRSSSDETLTFGAFTRYSFDYVEVPLMINYIDGGFMLNAGLSYGRLVQVREMTVDEVDLIDLEGENVNMNAVYLLAGIGYFITENIGVEARYSYAPFSVIDWQNSTTYDQPYISKSLSFRVLYMF